MQEIDEKIDKIIETIELKGTEVLEKINQLIKEGNVRRLTLRNSSGEEIVSTRLTLGAVTGVAAALLAPFLAAAGAAAALLYNCKLEVERIQPRTVPPEDQTDQE